MLLMKMTEKHFSKITEYERKLRTKCINALISNDKPVSSDWPLSIP